MNSINCACLSLTLSFPPSLHVFVLIFIHLSSPLVPQVMVGWSYSWCCVAWISPCPAPDTASATLHLAPSPAKPTTSMPCPRASRLRASASSCRTTRSSGCSVATSHPPPPCCGFTPTTSPTYSRPPSTALIAWRSSTLGTTGTWTPSPQTPSWVWVGYTPCTSTTVAWSACLQGSFQASIIFSISTYRYTDDSLLLSLLYIASVATIALGCNLSVSPAQHLLHMNWMLIKC